MKEKILITGSEGFIGSHLVETLIKKNYNIRAFVQYNSFSSIGGLEELSVENKKKIEIYFNNLINYIIEKIINTSAIDSIVNEYVTIPWDVEVKVSEVLLMLNKFKNEYLNFKAQQIFSNEFEKNLFITFKSYYEST